MMILVASFANSIKQKPFDGSNFKRWRDLLTLWLTTMNVMHCASGTASRVSRLRLFRLLIAYSGVLTT
jgi:hypothetical protein